MGKEKNLEGALLAFCNPLLDISVIVDAEYLAKYNLKANDAVLAAEPHLSIFAEIQQMSGALLTAGGAAQNTVRTAQWLLPPGSTCYIGCIGQDENGKKLRSVAEADGLQVIYMVNESAPTGQCACLISNDGHSRSLVANLGAANTYQPHHLRLPEVQAAIDRAQVIYISGYFLTASLDTILEVSRLAKAAGKIICMNLSAPFICKFFITQLCQVLPFVDFLFGNESEALALSDAFSWNLQEIDQIATKMSQELIGCSEGLVVITQGSQPTIVSQKDAPLQCFPVQSIPTDQIVDTNGAGDAFVGGYLSEYLKGGNLATCVEKGHYAASYIIRRSGVVFDKNLESSPGDN